MLFLVISQQVLWRRYRGLNNSPLVITPINLYTSYGLNTYALHLCSGHHVESCVSAWLGSTLCLVFHHGKSTLCLVFNGGLNILDYIQWSLTGAFPMFLNKTLIEDCPLFFNKTVYRRLSNAFEIKGVIGDFPLFFNKTVYRRLSNFFE